MKLLVVGPTGGTGLELVEQALEDGHQVTALARRPEALKIRHANLSVQQGDILDRAAVETAVRGQEAALSALGVRRVAKNTILSDGTRILIESMKKLGVKRLIVESSLGVGDSRGQLGGWYNWFMVPVFLKGVFAEKETQEALVRASSLDWVIVRPAILTNGPRTGRYRAGFTSNDGRIQRRISRADTAEFMLKQLTDNAYLRQTPGLSY
ncbi:MAG TPA: SDR family oxidoreductase [Terriglobia bacterium]|nr:SDR family oxidoreductase [Terriglobia bacterium]